jgi:septal ring factor EnvC (AmiA/AmiB activator)
VAVPTVTFILTFREIIHKKIKSQQGQIIDLQDDLADRKKKLDDVRFTLQETEKRLDIISGRLAETALETYEKEVQDHNEAPANQALLRWLEDEGHTAAKILFHRAEWAAAHAVKDLRPQGLVAAEAYALAATTLGPANDQAMRLLREVQAMRDEEGEAPAS